MNHDSGAVVLSAILMVFIFVLWSLGKFFGGAMGFFAAVPQAATGKIIVAQYNQPGIQFIHDHKSLNSQKYALLSRQ